MSWPDPGALAEYQLSLYHAMVTWASNALAAARQFEPDAESAGFFWMQGETDCISAPTANAYQTNFTKFIQKIRADFANTNLPFVFGRISDSAVMNYRAIVRAAQAAVDAADTNATMVSTDDLPLNATDNIHYTDAGLMTLGQRFAQAWLNLNRPPTATTLQATSIQISNATLSASITSGGTPTSFCFRFGATADYGSYSPTNTLPAAASAVVMNLTITGLAPDTTYHYQAVANNSLGTGTGVTLPSLPSPSQRLPAQPSCRVRSYRCSSAALPASATRCRPPLTCSTGHSARTVCSAPTVGLISWKPVSPICR